MADEKPIAAADSAVAKDVKKDVPEIKSDAKPIENVKPKSKGYSNPALKAMGIPNLRLPSRNWMIFWCVTSGLIGGVLYDKYQQKQIRKKWMDRVSEFGAKPLAPNELSRKVTIYVAPPPNDFLDESMSVFRKYVKPILNAGGVDYEIKSENRQGVIRSLVAAEIRDLRRQILENEKEQAQLKESQKWYNRVKNWLSKNKESKEEQEKALQNKKFTDDLKMKNVLGVYYNNIHKDDATISEDSLISDPSENGGIICIGRGAYKEYITGLHEGLLGPLDKPIEHKELEEFNEKQQELKPAPEKDGENEGESQIPIPKPFIEPTEYPNAKLAPEFNFTQGKVLTADKVSPFFQQSILAIPSFHLNGFLVIPQRIFRFYTRRFLTEEYGRKTVALVENLTRPFESKDVNLAKDEEDEWPKKWVQNGLEKNSEWTREFITDDRVLEKLHVFDDEKLN
ncbi:hypothetical protein WICANDRAFT_30840 [Wickerhamomyces anomalus NRRL Y-366-8]|uniref:Mitochondrial import inner membrane translocase subunit TIM54 n=1 Tax=Wickerhamomyces anomalus (strain ATCC 58044 / CBS 1984 / NCYC 433 / NRRL Y-366-8) TaxID=683960 RepID=A0A1E3P600_WICAA|nr:uncharacterized protein WICANDRAFT_30840 [Wickerhamomyces anomalus NRRL Y-366-8]ODQ60372.1 hypothetical protein WICANDRAFT_30840 [Wickerhamomyces anomalus NRRL Y-366-8]